MIADFLYYLLIPVFQFDFFVKTLKMSDSRKPSKNSGSGRTRAISIILIFKEINIQTLFLSCLILRKGTGRENTKAINNEMGISGGTKLEINLL